MKNKKNMGCSKKIKVLRFDIAKVTVFYFFLASTDVAAICIQLLLIMNDLFCLISKVKGFSMHLCVMVHVLWTKRRRLISCGIRICLKY